MASITLRIGKFVIATGICLLAHSVFSAVQHRQLLKALDQDDTGMPVDVAAECLIAALVVCCGIVLISGDLKPIKASLSYSTMTFDQLNLRPDFMSFNHRGRLLSDLKS